MRMDLETRIGAAAEWLYRNQMSDEPGGTGWGWLAGVPPNAMSTAEVVCALRVCGREIPWAQEVSELLRQPSLDGGERMAPIDTSWRLRALRELGAQADDADEVELRESLLAAQDADTGGWPMSSRSGPVSVMSTANAIAALDAAASSDEDVAQAILWGAGCLVAAILDHDPRPRPLYESAYVVAALVRPEIAAIGGERFAHARELAVCRLLAALRRGDAGVAEETFVRDGVAESWRHLTLHAALGAVLAAEPRSIADPAVSQALTPLLELQETDRMHAQYGGFRTSPDGYVTTSATAQGLTAMTLAKQGSDEIPSPARNPRIQERSRTAHLAEPHRLAIAGGRPVVMNAHAGTALWICGVAAGLTIAAMAIVFSGHLGHIGSRALTAWGMLFVALGTYAGIGTRLPRIPRGQIATTIFGTYTAVVLPLIAFLLR
ncbi:hypothetical protein ABIA39_004084 [Nocardia sp. GAS34]